MQRLSPLTFAVLKKSSSPTLKRRPRRQTMPPPLATCTLTLLVLASHPVTRCCTHHLHLVGSILVFRAIFTSDSRASCYAYRIHWQKWGFVQPCFNLILFYICVYCFLQRGGGVHGPALQAPALWWQETSVWWQEEHLYSACTSYWEWKGKCL